MPRPATGQTPVRHLRLGDEIWEPLTQAAREDGTTATELVKAALADYMAKRAKRKAAAAKKAGGPDE